MPTEKTVSDDPAQWIRELVSSAITGSTAGVAVGAALGSVLMLGPIGSVAGAIIGGSAYAAFKQANHRREIEATRMQIGDEHSGR